jgi:very-short-patch-repair endonuclease
LTVAINQHRNPHPNPSPLGEGLSTASEQPMTQIEKINSTMRRKALLPREKGWDEGSQTLKFARQLRRNQTDAEKLLWSKLRNRALNGNKFRRQVPVGNYIADFFYLDAMLIVELDGGQHAEQQEYDQRRTHWLESQGFRVLRFWNYEVLTNIDGVCLALTEALSTYNNMVKLET